MPEGEGCCGALVHHMGREDEALAAARRNVDAWMREIDAGGLDAIVITASGCGTTIKDYGFMLRTDPAYAEKAAKVSALARDITEYLATLDLPEPALAAGLTVAYHSACSMQHGQKITRAAEGAAERRRLHGARIRPRGICAAVRPAPTTSCSRRSPRRCRDRKVANIEATRPDVIATGNIGCITQIAAARGCRSCTRSNCSTGPMAARVPKAFPRRRAASRGSRQHDDVMAAGRP